MSTQHPEEEYSILTVYCLHASFSALLSAGHFAPLSDWQLLGGTLCCNQLESVLMGLPQIFFSVT